MKESDFYRNQTMMLRDLQIRVKLGQMVEDAEPRDLKALGFIIARKEWTEEEIQKDLGSSVIEQLLDHIDFLNHERLMEVRADLAKQSILL